MVPTRRVVSTGYMELTTTRRDRHRDRLEEDVVTAEVAAAEATATTVTTVVAGQATFHNKEDQTEDHQATQVTRVVAVLVDEDLLEQDPADRADHHNRHEDGYHRLRGRRLDRSDFDSGCGNLLCGAR